MVIQPKKKLVAYRCAACESTVYSMAGMFSLSGDMFKLKCTCGGSEMKIENTQDNMVRMTAPCVFCGTTHQFRISRKTIMDKDLFAFPCSYAGFDMVFIGDEEKVQKAVEEADREIMETLDEDAHEQLQQVRSQSGTSLYYDAMIANDILYTLGQLHDDGKIYCDCEDGGDFVVDQEDDSLVISCKKCGCKQSYFAYDNVITRNLLDADFIRLEKE